jgi:hypothetical protein
MVGRTSRMPYRDVDIYKLRQQLEQWPPHGDIGVIEQVHRRAKS